jgi:acetoin utilization deacetylase AcuC-like enzyme
MRRTGYIQPPECLAHDTGEGHVEQPGRIRAIQEAVEASGLELVPVEYQRAQRADIERVHAPEYYESLERICREGLRYPDPDTEMGPLSWPAALAAAGAGISACRAVLAREADNVFCAVRPPGHHAERDRAMGFCLFNNIAVAARWLQAEAGLKRIAILDWDVHHGNGTQNAFHDDPGVFYVSIHQERHYPGTGFVHERGVSDNILNIPMPRYAETGLWLQVLEDRAAPALLEFEPEFLLLSAGFDAHIADSIAHQELDAQAYFYMTMRVRDLAGGRLVSMLEGGYDLRALGECVVAHLKGLQYGG